MKGCPVGVVGLLPCGNTNSCAKLDNEGLSREGLPDSLKQMNLIRLGDLLSLFVNQKVVCAITREVRGAVRAEVNRRSKEF